MSQLPKAKEITNLFLYGQSLRPANLIDPTLIRESTDVPPPVQIDINAYMSGPGRFATPNKFSVIQKFFNPLTDPASFQLAPGTYTKTQIFAAFGVTVGWIGIDQSQYDDGKDNFLERAYIWNKTAFMLRDGAKFVVESNGNRYIEDFAITPYLSDNKKENFDFTAGTTFGDIANSLLEPKVDPSKIGRTVEFDFTTQRTVQGRFTFDDYQSASSGAAAQPADPLLYAYIAANSTAFLDQLYQSGTTRFLDQDGRMIIYGTNAQDNLNPGRFDNVAIDRNLRDALNSKGATIIAGDGGDTLSGGIRNDALHGGVGTDAYIFSGNWGKDTITDSDGQGVIQIDGKALAGTFRGTGTHNGYAFDMGGGVEAGLYVMKSGNTYKATIVKGTDTANTITINNFDLTKAKGEQGYMGIKLGPAKVALTQESGNFWAVAGATLDSLSGKTTTVAEGGGTSFGLNLSSGAKANDTITLSFSGANGKVILGDTTVDANGAVITLVEGQTQVRFSLVHDGELSADATASLSATYNTNGTSATSNTWSVNLRDSGEADNTFNGDYAVQTQTLTGNPLSRFNAEGISVTVVAVGQQRYFTDGQGNLLAGNGSVVTDNTLYGTAANDRINGLTGNDLLGGGAGNDTIDGGAGSDMIGGGAGDDHILGGDGDDYISSAANTLSGRQQRGPDDLWANWAVPAGTTPVVAHTMWGLYLSQGKPVWGSIEETQTDAQSDVIDAGAGDDWVIASWGHDRIKGGDGNDQLEGLAGDDIVEGDEGDDYLNGDGILMSSYLNSVPGASHGADFLDGGAGHDNLTGGGSDDNLFGGVGNDKLWGDTGGESDSPYFLALEFHGDDYLDGEDGDDYLEGGGGADVLYGGDGADNLFGDLPSIHLKDAAALDPLAWGHDYLVGEAGNDSLTGGGGHDVLYGGTGNDYLDGDEPAVKLVAQAHGDDCLDGEDGNDSLYGRGGADTLYGGAGNDYLDGGEGADYMDGGAGSDTYVVDSEDDVVVEAAAPPGGDAPMTASLAMTAMAPMTAGEDIDTIEAHISYTLGEGFELLTLGGTAAINGTGNAQDNSVRGNSAANTLAGAAGRDWLSGGAGDDVYVFNRGDGADTVSNTDFLRDTADPLLQQAVDTVRFGDGIGTADLQVRRQGDDLLLKLKGTDEYVFVANHYGATVQNNNETRVYDHKIDRVQFADGTVWDQAKLELEADRAAHNQAPAFNATIPTQQSRAGTAFSWTVPAGTATDPDAWDTVTYSVKRVDGSPLPEWLSFDAATGTLSGMPGTDDVGNLQLMLWATDNYGSAVGRGFWMQVSPPNQAPVISGTPPAQLQAGAGTAFSWTVPAGLMTDPDAGDSIAYSVALADGAPLPAWLAFDPATRTLSGTAGAADAGALQLVLQGTDPWGSAVSHGFTLTVTPGNQTPVLNAPLPDHRAPQHAAFVFTVPQDAFTDPDAGDTLTYSATLANGSALPSWLYFDAPSLTFVGVPRDAGHLSVRLKATDQSGAAVSDVFDIVTDALSLIVGTTDQDVLYGDSTANSLHGMGGTTVFSAAPAMTCWTAARTWITCAAKRATICTWSTPGRAVPRSSIGIFCATAPIHRCRKRWTRYGWGQA